MISSGMGMGLNKWHLRDVPRVQAINFHSPLQIFGRLACNALIDNKKTQYTGVGMFLYIIGASACPMVTSSDFY
jgi:hypothetical protein